MEDVAKAASNHHWGEGYLEINWGWANMRKHVRATQSLEIKHLWFECLNFSVISSCFHKNPHHGKGLINQSGRRDVSEFSPYLGMAPTTPCSSIRFLLPEFEDHEQQPSNKNFCCFSVQVMRLRAHHT